MSSFGVLSTGFSQATLDDVKTAIEEKQKADIAANLNQSSQSLLGQLNAIFASKLAELWEVALAVYRSEYPDTATGDALDNVCALTGVSRLAATKSKATLTACGTPATALTAGRVVSVVGTPASRFDTDAAATITLLTSWVALTAYVVGDRRTNSTKCYECITAGTSAGAGGPTTTAADITDGSVHWKYIGDGTGAVDVAATCETTGPVVGNALSLTVIETPVSGWSTVRNLAAATIGTDLETDVALRARREALLRLTGAATVEAIRSDLLDVSGVTEAFVFENTTLVTDVDGVPGKAIECVVLGGTDAAVEAAIFASKAAGIESYGSTSGSVTDSQGIAHTVKFSRPTAKAIKMIIDVTTDPLTFPADGAAQIKAAAKAHGDTLGIGDDVISSAAYPSIFGVSGVLDVTKVWIAFSPTVPTVPTTLVISSREVATFATVDITVNVT